jgi:hypothetical protein
VDGMKLLCLLGARSTAGYWDNVSSETREKVTLSCQRALLITLATNEKSVLAG